MQTIKVDLGQNSYNIIVGEKILPKLGAYLRALKIGQDAIVITNSYVRKLHGKNILFSLKQEGFSVKVIDVLDSEKSKSAQTAFDLLGKMAAYDIKKKIFIIAFGGGVVGDLAGFVAAVYKRGIPYVQVPTSFLAQIDSAIGGKTAIDLSSGKNLVGAFYQPKLVFSDVALLATLSKRQLRNGLAEAVKYGVIRDPKLFAYILKNYSKLLSGNLKTLTSVVASCSRIKADVVSVDEKETKGVRVILNFGHTIGHAIEAASKYEAYQHGEAIALGMRAAAEIAHRLGLFSLKDWQSLENLLSAIGLPEKIKKVSLDEILKATQHDKKIKSGKNRFVLPVRIGAVKVVEGVSEKLIKQVIKARY